MNLKRKQSFLKKKKRKPSYDTEAALQRYWIITWGNFYACNVNILISLREMSELFLYFGKPRGMKSRTEVTKTHVNLPVLEKATLYFYIDLRKMNDLCLRQGSTTCGPWTTCGSSVVGFMIFNIYGKKTPNQTVLVKKKEADTNFTCHTSY